MDVHCERRLETVEETDDGRERETPPPIPSTQDPSVADSVIKGD